MRIELREPDLTGTFACLDEGGQFPAVLALGGSEGGIPAHLVDMIVPGGFACLGLAYHQGLMGKHLEFVPVDMYDLPLERIERGIRWLIEQPNAVTHDGRVGVVGASKGGELALLVAATFPDLVGPVVAYTPSSVVWQGFSWSFANSRETSTWSHRGEPLPYTPIVNDAAPTMSERGMSILPVYDRSLDDSVAVARAAIAVENATGPILVVSGEDDAMWPAERMCRMVVDRMARAGRTADIRHLNYPDAGHMVMGRFSIDADEAPQAAAMDLGGTLEADTAAGADGRPQVFAHLKQSAS